MPRTDSAAKKRALFRSTVLVTAATLLGYGASFAFSVVVAKVFGAGADMDAYYASTSLPNLLNVILVGSLQITLVPVFVSYTAEGKETEAWTIFSSLFSATLLLFLLLTAIGVVFALPIVRLTVPGFNALQLTLTVGVMRIELPAIIFSGLTGLLASVHYAHNRFLLPSFVPLLGTLLKVAIVIGLGRIVGVYAVALGDLIGAAAGCISLLPIMFKEGRYRPVIAWRHPGVRQTVGLALPWLLGNLVARSDPLFMRAIASGLPTGSISYLGYAERFRIILASIASGGLAKTLFPRLSETATNKPPVALGRIVVRGARWLAVAIIPMVTFFVALSVPVIQTLFERGSFTREATVGTAIAFAGYALSVFTGSLGAVDSRSFYAQKDTRTPVLISTLSLLLFVPLAWGLSKWLSYLGIALAVSIRSAIIHATLFYVLSRRLGGIGLKKFLVFVLRVLVISATLGLVLAWTSNWGRFTEISVLPRLLSLTGSFGLAMAVYAVAVRFVAKDEMADLEEIFSHIVRRVRMRMAALS